MTNATKQRVPALGVPPLQLWGGMECTINRVHDVYFDQLQKAGHLARIPEDITRFAALGLRTLRTSLHWERFAAAEAAGIGSPWQVFDDTLTALRQFHIEPIAGLVHHGSGPPTTSLIDPGFPAKLAAYALQVARRYPGITAYTPVNEPHTTARFSCLYGHWFPHRRSTDNYLRALVNQVKATILAMQAIRTVQPAARLITTEDGGRTYATPPLRAEQERRENRRWLGTDLLCGLVDPHHPLFLYLTANGISPGELTWFADNPCYPDVLGLNYYLTSDRFLDHRTHLYPPGYAGGDTGHQALVDVEAVRVLPAGIAGAERILLDAWNRYHLPVAITECHLGESSDNQIRWVDEVWRQAHAARAGGASVVAVTTWALLGSFNWPSLVTRDEGIYESGAFTLAPEVSPPTSETSLLPIDIRRSSQSGESASTPAQTPLAPFLQQIASGQPATHPALGKSGWWHNPSRLTFPAPEKTDDYGASSLRTRAIVST